MLNLIKKAIRQLLEDMDSGNSNLSEKELLELFEFLQKLNSPTMSKVQAYNYIGVCRATFDNYIKKGLIPKGIKTQGHKELSWNKCDLDKFLENKK